MSEFVQQLVNALSLGSTYALLALGLAMVFSIMRLVNFAHGELLTVAAYALWGCQQAGLPFGVSVAGAIVAAALAAVAMELVAFRPLRGASFATLLFASLAVSLVIQNLLRALISPRQKAVAVPDVFNQVVTVGDITIAWLNIITTGTCLAALLTLTVFLRRSNQGLGMLAAAQDFSVARLVGVRANRVIAGAFALSGVLAAIAAVLYVGRRGTIDPAMGFQPVIAALVATVIGGLGSLSGAVAGGFILGAVQVALDATLPEDAVPYGPALSLALVIVILFFRPRGLLTPVTEER